VETDSKGGQGESGDEGDARVWETRVEEECGFAGRVDEGGVKGDGEVGGGYVQYDG
jgi:hypothetical protein